MQEIFGEIQGLQVAWIGDGNNVCHSYLEAAGLFDFTLHVACPKGYQPSAEWVEKANGRVRFFDSPEEAVRDVQVVTTDVWASMGQEDETDARLEGVQGLSDHTRTVGWCPCRCVFFTLPTSTSG